MWSPSLCSPSKYLCWPKNKTTRRGVFLYIRFVHRDGTNTYHNKLKKDEAIQRAKKEMAKNKMLVKYSLWYYCDFLTHEAI